MKHDFALRNARLDAQRLFSTQSALALVPPPANRSVVDLNRHIRQSLGLVNRGRPLLQQWGVAA